MKFAFLALFVFPACCVSAQPIKNCEADALNLVSRLQSEHLQSIKLACISIDKETGVANQPKEAENASDARPGRVRNRVIQHKLRKMFFATVREEWR